VDFGDEKLKGYVFKTTVDGAERETLVAWSETNPTTVDVRAAERTFDYLGRDLLPGGKVELTRATVFMLLPPGGSKSLKIAPPPSKPQWVAGKPCPVVLQLVGQGDVKQSAFRLDNAGELRLVAYNFRDVPARGKLAVHEGTVPSAEIEIAAGGREERTIKAGGNGTVTVRLDLGDAGHPIVSARTKLLTPGEP
jgi:hypothetical protein